MKIIEIEALENGAHRNQTSIGSDIPIPEGWVIIPEEIEIPDTFPFVDIEVEDGVITSMTAGVVPDVEPDEDEGDMWDELAEAIREGVNEV